MAWHFHPDTGTPFWLNRASSLEFDPRADIKSFEDLRLFPNVTDELRDVPVEMLIPRGFGPRPDIVGVIESGGTTGAPKRIPLLREFATRLAASESSVLGKANTPKDKGWLTLFPSGPHGAFEQMKRAAADYGNGIAVFGVDLDPRWVKKQTVAGNTAVVDAYVDHIIDQAAYVLKDQNVAVLRVTAPLLARLVRRDDLVGLIRDKVSHIIWGGAHMDADSRYFYRTDVFPGVHLSGRYGTTMALGAGGSERPDFGHDDVCIFDPTVSPHVTFSVVDPATGEKVPYGQRGQLVVNHLSMSFLLPNNAERDLATRIEPVADQVGDSVADIEPFAEFSGTQVVEGVY
ncbi:phenylacetate--CoA ligase family protein [Nonomuraea cypriaca]|nr:phenazine antibiotic biosynthesis protein [Nonomuraea cypriaca]